MKVKQIIELLDRAGESDMHIMLPNGAFVAPNFHVTEVGFAHKLFYDCGGTEREMNHCVVQIWTADDFDHRLPAKKLRDIMLFVVGATSTKLDKSMESLQDMPVMIEHGKDVASQYFVSNVELTPKGPLFTLVAKETECLAPDKCGVGGCVQECGC